MTPFPGTVASRMVVSHIAGPVPPRVTRPPNVGPSLGRWWPRPIKPSAPGPLGVMHEERQERDGDGPCVGTVDAPSGATAKR